MDYEQYYRGSGITAIIGDWLKRLPHRVIFDGEINGAAAGFVKALPGTISDLVFTQAKVEISKVIKEADNKLVAAYSNRDMLACNDWQLVKNTFEKLLSRVEFEYSQKTAKDTGQTYTATSADVVDTGQPQKRDKPNKAKEPARRKGRPKKPFKDMMIDDTNGGKLQKIHDIMKGKKGKGAALIVLAAVKKGWLQKPTFAQIEEEFGNIGTRQSITTYLHEEKFTKDEIEGAVNSFE